MVARELDTRTAAQTVNGYIQPVELPGDGIDLVLTVDR
jgi:hypothetical protein